MNEESLTKGERRDAKRVKRLRMAVSGTGVRVLQGVILAKAQEAKRAQVVYRCGCECSWCQAGEHFECPFKGHVG